MTVSFIHTAKTSQATTPSSISFPSVHVLLYDRVLLTLTRTESKDLKFFWPSLTPFTSFPHRLPSQPRKGTRLHSRAGWLRKELSGYASLLTSQCSQNVYSFFPGYSFRRSIRWQKRICLDNCNNT